VFSIQYREFCIQIREFCFLRLDRDESIAVAWQVGVMCDPKTVETNI